MTESERALATLHLQARVAVAIAILAFVGIVQQTGAAGPEVPARALAVGLALAVAAGVEAFVARHASRATAASAGTITEFFALALAVALFARFAPIAPVVLAVPIALGAVALPRIQLLYLSALATAIVLEIGLLGLPTPLAALAAGAGWGVLYISAAALASAVGRAYRRAQRQTESAYASVATLNAATSYGELARILFAYAERALDLPLDAPAALLFDDRGIGTLAAVEARGIDPERRARFRIGRAATERLRAVGGDDGEFVDPGEAFGRDEAIPDELRAGRPFLLPLRDARRLVGLAVFAAERARRRTAERRAELARVAEQVATTAVRIRGGRAVEAQRVALAGVLEAHSAERAEMQVATWLARSARDVAEDAEVAVLQDLPNGGCRAILALGLSGRDVERGCLPLVEEGRRRGVAVVVTDGSRERRVALPPFLREGASALVPVRGQGTYLLVHRPERDGLSSAQLQLLVLLGDEASTLLASAYAARGAAVPPPAAGRTELRLAAVAAHTGGPARGEEAETRARIVDAFRLAVEGNQPSLAGSGERVAAVASALAESLGLDEQARDALYVAALLRDVGELGIDRRVLDTPGALSAEQREVVQRHPILGETILATLSYLEGAARIVRTHHERWDGTGYPDRLAGSEIPLGARILGVADAFVAMTSDRPYRGALQPAEAMAALIGVSGKSFDPAVIEAFVALGRAGRVPLR